MGLKTRKFSILFIWCVLFCASDISAQNSQNTPVDFRNPILSGFHPDPSICRVGDYYYLVNSSFEWFPGVPIHRSKDLVNWELIGNVLDRPSQLNVKDNVGIFGGIWAPTIRFHKGLFYMITTAKSMGGNFFVTAENPAGPWSDPFWLNAPGIDPSLFFDDDGKVYYTGAYQDTDQKNGFGKEGKIYLQELDLQQKKLLGEPIILTDGHAINAKFAEGPHIYKINGKYLLLIAEGGTWTNHAVTAFVSDKITGKYEALQVNPVLTHRNLGRNHEITTIGHADLVETESGEWWAVALGVRPLFKSGDNRDYYYIGRETFLTKVVFDGVTPLFNPPHGKILSKDKRPNLPWSPIKQLRSRDEFNSEKLGFEWNFYRTPQKTWWNLQAKKGFVRINLLPAKATEQTNFGFIGRRMQHNNFNALTKVSFTPKSENETAGFLVIMKHSGHFRLEITKSKGDRLITLFKVQDGKETEVTKEKLSSSGDVILGVQADQLDFRFVFGNNEKSLKQVGETQDGRIITSQLARGFTGAYVGMYASSNGVESSNYADFDWFEYQPKE